MERERRHPGFGGDELVLVSWMWENAADGSCLAGTHGSEHRMTLHVAGVVGIAEVLPLCRPQHPESCTAGTFHPGPDHVSLRSYLESVLGARDEDMVQLPLRHALGAVEGQVLLETFLHDVTHVFVARWRAILAPVSVVRLLLVHPLGVLATPSDKKQRQLARRRFRIADPADPLGHRRRRHRGSLAGDEVVFAFGKHEGPRLLLLRIYFGGVHGLLQGPVQPSVRGNEHEASSLLLPIALATRGPAEKQRRLRVPGIGLEVEQDLLSLLHGPSRWWRAGRLRVRPFCPVGHALGHRPATV
mmetsp:Transcript_65795/g.157172  ORF Transcript_65795/g.157172 Transcript_65795/m.157172 type:complete len:301 (+) Transcript_65795:856-1758(+)